MANLTPKQEKFCIEYIKTGSKSEAYRLSYECSKMNPDTINRAASAMFDNYKITTRVQELQKEIELSNKVDINWCIQKLKDIVETDDKDRVQAIDKLMKHLGGYEVDNKQKVNDVTIFQLPDNKR